MRTSGHSGSVPTSSPWPLTPISTCPLRTPRATSARSPWPSARRWPCMWHWPQSSRSPSAAAASADSHRPRRSCARRLPPLPRDSRHPSRWRCPRRRLPSPPLQQRRRRWSPRRSRSRNRPPSRGRARAGCSCRSRRPMSRRLRRCSPRWTPSIRAPCASCPSSRSSRPASIRRLHSPTSDSSAPRFSRSCRRTEVSRSCRARSKIRSSGIRSGRRLPPRRRSPRRSTARSSPVGRCCASTSSSWDRTRPVPQPARPSNLAQPTRRLAQPSNGMWNPGAALPSSVQRAVTALPRV